MASAPRGPRSRALRGTDPLYGDARLRPNRAPQSSHVSGVIPLVNPGSGSEDPMPLAELNPALSLRREGTRKALHLVSMAVPVSYAAGVSQRVVVWVLVFALAVALAVE